MSTSILGTRVLRVEDPRFLSGRGTFVANSVDSRLDGALHLYIVASTHAHARIRSIDISAARGCQGVVAIYTAHDLDLPAFPLEVPALLPSTIVRPLLAGDTVRYVGEPIVAIVTEQPAQGPDAAESVIIDYDPLPVVVDVERSVANDVVLHPEHGSNVVLETTAGDVAATEERLARCDVVVRQRVVNQKMSTTPLEPRSSAAAWDNDGRLHVWQSCQGAHPTRTNIATALGIDESLVHVTVPDVGGGFGAKGGLPPETVLAAWSAKQLGRPVRWHPDRTYDMTGLGHGRAQLQFIELGGTLDGKIEAYKLRVLSDAGAWARTGAILVFPCKSMHPGVYDIPVTGFQGHVVVTNTAPVTAFRGAGRPEATAALERAVDLYAAEIGMDPLEVRRRNFIQPHQFPFRTTAGSTYDSGDYEGALDRAVAAAGYTELRAEQARRRAAGDRLAIGIGVCSYVEVTGTGGGPEYGAVEVLPDGTVVAHSGATPFGMSHDTSWAMLVSEKLGVPMDRITVVHGDTDVVARGGGTGGSRSLQLAGTAVWGAAEGVLEQAKTLAAELLEADPADIVVDAARGVLHVAGTPTVAKTWAELAAAAIAVDQRLWAEVDFKQAGSSYPFGAHIAVVEVDLETGFVRLVRHVACDDAGRIINPMVVEGQVHGGIGQGVAQALLEEIVYDADGNPLTNSFADYPVISAAELPMFERVPMETPSPLNELGAKGIGESGTIGSTPAVQNAVIDALAHLGVRHIDMPCSPERVWRAIEKTKHR